MNKLKTTALFLSLIAYLSTIAMASPTKEESTTPKSSATSTEKKAVPKKVLCPDRSNDLYGEHLNLPPSTPHQRKTLTFQPFPLRDEIDKLPFFAPSPSEGIGPGKEETFLAPLPCSDPSPIPQKVTPRQTFYTLLPPQGMGQTVRKRARLSPLREEIKPVFSVPETPCPITSPAPKSRKILLSTRDVYHFLFLVDNQPCNKMISAMAQDISDNVTDDFTRITSHVKMLYLVCFSTICTHANFDTWNLIFNKLTDLEGLISRHYGFENALSESLKKSVRLINSVYFSKRRGELISGTSPEIKFFLDRSLPEESFEFFWLFANTSTTKTELFDDALLNLQKLASNCVCSEERTASNIASPKNPEFLANSLNSLLNLLLFINNGKLSDEVKKKSAYILDIISFIGIPKLLKISISNKIHSATY